MQPVPMSSITCAWSFAADAWWWPFWPSFTPSLAIDENTLYPLLRRLESQGLLVSQWREEEKRNKRFYRLSPLGEEVLPNLLAEWRQMSVALERILGDRAVSSAPKSRTQSKENEQPCP
jgi:DNA-binding PadR family transcriptional regulator